MAVDKEHAATILHRVFEYGISSDQITLISGKDNQKVQIHRPILIASSKYFEAALGPNFQEGNQTEFVLDETDGSTVKAIVGFCYHGRIELNEENVSKYLAIASSVEFDLLERKCWPSILEQLTFNNVVETWTIADKYSNRDVCRRVVNLVCESLEKFTTSRIQAFDHGLMQAVLTSDTIHATEEFVFKCSMNWFQFNEDDRTQHMTAFLKLIRLNLIPAEVLNDDLFVAAFKKFDCFELLFAEHKKRILCGSLNVGIRRRRSIFSICTQQKDVDGAEFSAVKIERFNSALHEFEGIREITLGNCRYFGVILHENKLYILGGTVNGVIQKSVSVFDLSSGKEVILPEMSFARYCFPSIVIGKYIYVFGGRNGSSVINSCERFDVELKTWTVLKPMNVARDYAAVVVFHGYIYVAGGRTNGHTTVETFELYDPAENEWRQLASMNDARCAFSLFRSDTFFYAIGCKSTVERFDALKNVWNKVESVGKSLFITNSVETVDGIFAITKTGEFEKFGLDANGRCSFQPLSKSKNESKFMGNHYLFQN